MSENLLKLFRQFYSLFSIFFLGRGTVCAPVCNPAITRLTRVKELRREAYEEKTGLSIETRKTNEFIVDRPSTYLSPPPDTISGYLKDTDQRGERRGGRTTATSEDERSRRWLCSLRDTVPVNDSSELSGTLRLNLIRIHLVILSATHASIGVYIVDICFVKDHSGKIAEAQGDSSWQK